MSAFTNWVDSSLSSKWDVISYFMFGLVFGPFLMIQHAADDKSWREKTAASQPLDDRLMVWGTIISPLVWIGGILAIVLL